MSIDFDNTAERLDELRECLNELPQPFKIRKSSGGEGVHIVLAEGVDDTKYREKWDDPVRLRLDRIRAEHGLSGNILHNVKNGKKAGEWVEIKDGLKFKNTEELQKFITEELK